MGILDFYSRLGDRGASESLESAKYKEKEKEIRENPPEIDPDSPANNMDDFFNPKQTFLAGAKGAAEGAATGFGIGSKVAPGTGGGLAGGLIGGAIGFITGAMEFDMGQQQTFTQALDAYNINKDLKKQQEKMSEAARREAARLQKSQASKKGSGMQFSSPSVGEVESDIMAIMEGPGETRYDRKMAGYYGSMG